MTDQIFRCSDGHLFTANWLKTVVFSAHLAGTAWLRCPVDRKWRTATRLSRKGLSESEFAEAKQHRF